MFSPFRSCEDLHSFECLMLPDPARSVGCNEVYFIILFQLCRSPFRVVQAGPVPIGLVFAIIDRLAVIDLR